MSATSPSAGAATNSTGMGGGFGRAGGAGPSRPQPATTATTSAATTSLMRLLHRVGDRVVERLHHLDAGEEFILGLDHRPRRDLGAGAIDHVADGALVGVPLGAVAPVFFGDLEALPRDLLALLEAPELL